jgi:hypothetical protein
MNDVSKTNSREGKCSHKFVNRFHCSRNSEPGQDVCLAHLKERTPEQVKRFDMLINEMLRENNGDFLCFIFPEKFTFTKDFTKYCGVPTEKTLNFSYCTFLGDADFSYAEFKGTAPFLGSRFEGNAIFSNARFAGKAFFDHTTIRGNADFDGAEIEGDAIFSNAQIGDKADFSSARIGGDANFSGTRFRQPVSFGETIFRRETCFDGVTLPPAGNFRGATVPLGYGESFCRFAKQVCQNMGEYREAGDWHFKERCHALQAKCLRPRSGEMRSRWKKPSVWPELVFMQWLFGYGERPWRVVRGALAVIVLCALGYLLLNGVELNSTSGHLHLRSVQLHLTGDDFLDVPMDWTAGSRLSSIGDALYFSVVTFTTLGFGDFRPVGTGARLLAGAEAFSGALMMALLAVSLAKRFSRG